MSEGTAPNRRARSRLVTGLAAVGLALPLVWTARVLPVEVPLTDGIAWLTNESRGEVARVNGQTGQVEATLDVGDAQSISIAQSDGVAVVMIDGELRSIDLSTLEWGGSIPTEGEVVTGEDEDGEPVVYLMEPDGLVLTLDPMTLETEGEVRLDGEPSSGVVAQGRLVLPVSDSGGTSVHVVDGDDVVGDVEVGSANDRVRVSRVGERVAAVNLTQRTLDTLDPSESDLQPGTSTDLDLPSGELLVPTELPDGRLWLVAVRSGELLAVDLDTGDVDGPVEVAEDRSDLAAPVVLDDRVFVLDRDAGEVIQVDTDSLEEIRPRHTLAALGVNGTCDCEIMAKGGKVFVNDPASEVAVVLSSDGTAVQIDKYDENGPAVPMPSSELASEGEDEGDEPDDPPASEAPDTGGDEEPTPPPPDATPPIPDPPVPPPPETSPDLPTPSVPRPPTSPSSTSTTTTSTTTTTTTTTTTQPPAPTPEPPGGIQLSATPGDGQVTLDWTAAASTTPVTYHITSDRAIGGATTWRTSELSRPFTGLSNGESYRFTVTPTNEGGNGPTSSTNVVPVGQPSVSGLTNTSAGGRDFNVTFNYNLNGSQLQSCTVNGAAATCSGGSGSATVSVSNYNSTHAFTVEVVTSSGTASGTTPSATSAAKPLTVDGSRARWDTSCYWDEHGTDRPVHDTPITPCDNGHTRDEYSRMVANGSTQRVLCWRQDVRIRDNQLNYSTIWLQLEDGGWMSALYFTNWGSADDNLPQCS